MIKEFKRYFQYKDKSKLFDLIEAIKYDDLINYKNKTKEIFDIFKTILKNNPNFIQLKSNGSLGKIQFYKVGPYFDIIIESIDRKIKYTNNNIIFVDPHLFFYKKYIELFAIDIDSKFKSITCNFINKKNEVKFLILELYEKYGKINIFSHPNTFLYLFSNKEFTNWIDENTDKIQFTNTDCEPFFKKPNAFVNDQMVNWKNGLNFYTCIYGNKHFLPFFHIENNKCYNLLNLSRDFNEDVDLLDDFIYLKDENICKCGKMSFKINFIPHYESQIKINENIFFNLNIPNNLISNFYNLQFIQKDKKIFCCYVSADIDEHDFDIISNSINHPLIFLKNSFFYIGKKRLTFWYDKFNLVEIKKCPTHLLKQLSKKYLV